MLSCQRLWGGCAFLPPPWTDFLGCEHCQIYNSLYLKNDSFMEALLPPSCLAFTLAITNYVEYRFLFRNNLNWEKILWYIVSFLKRAAESFPLHNWAQFPVVPLIISVLSMTHFLLTFFLLSKFFLVKQELTGTAYKMTLITAEGGVCIFLSPLSLLALYVLCPTIWTKLMETPTLLHGIAYEISAKLYYTLKNFDNSILNGT